MDNDLVPSGSGPRGRLDELARQVVAQRPRLGSVRMVVVDGPAASGKTTFAGRFATVLRATGATVAEVHTDDLLEGWTDPKSFWPRLISQVLEPFQRGQAARHQRYDWIIDRFADEWSVVEVPDILLLEGVTSGCVASQPYRGLGIYVYADPALRLARGLVRDGEALREAWLRWMAAEEEHFAADDTASRLDVLVDGAPTIPYDPEREYVRLPVEPG